MEIEKNYVVEIKKRLRLGDRKNQRRGDGEYLRIGHIINLSHELYPHGDRTNFPLGDK